MRAEANPWRGRGLPDDAHLADGEVRRDPHDVLALLTRCPVAAPTPLLEAPALAASFGVGDLWLKDERDRMGLGSFKALGAAHVIARMAADRLDRPGRPATPEELATALADTTFVCASAGNHGLSLAAAAPVFGARAVVHVSEGVPEAFARRLRDRGAEVVRSGATYEASMAAASADADGDPERVLLSDSSWPGYTELPTGVMEGYLVLAHEAVEAMAPPASHVLLQAGVGGLAAAVTALVRDRWGDAPTIVVVEPSAAPALQASVRAGRPVVADGPVSSMGRLDCKEPSHLALRELALEADVFATLDDHEVDATVALLADHDLATTSSGAAGVAVLHHASASHRDLLGLDAHSRVLAVLTEGPEDAP